MNPNYEKIVSVRILKEIQMHGCAARTSILIKLYVIILIQFKEKVQA